LADSHITNCPNTTAVACRWAKLLGNRIMNTNNLTVEYRETVSRSIECEGKVADLGRIGYGHVWIRIEPVDYKSANIFKNEIVGGAIPSEFIPSVEKSIHAVLEKGPIGKNPTLGILVTLYDGSYQESGSTNDAFYEAAKMACEEALRKADPVLLEPVMELKATTPDEHLGNVMGLLNRLRGITHGMEDLGNEKLVTCDIPQIELIGFEELAEKIIGRKIEMRVKFKQYDRAPSFLDPDGDEPSSMAISVA